MQTILVAVLLLCAVIYFGHRIVTSLRKGGGCGCGCSNCHSAKKNNRK